MKPFDCFGYKCWHPERHISLRFYNPKVFGKNKPIFCWDVFQTKTSCMCMWSVISKTVLTICMLNCVTDMCCTESGTLHCSWWHTVMTNHWPLHADLHISGHSFSITATTTVRVKGFVNKKLDLSQTSHIH